MVKLAVSCFHLSPAGAVQEELFAENRDKRRKEAKACDSLTDRFGEFIITSALMLGMEDVILDRIAFGGVKELEELYEQPGEETTSGKSFSFFTPPDF